MKPVRPSIFREHRHGKHIIPGEVFILVASILWGTTGTAQTFAPDSAHPLSVGTLRLISGAVLLFLISLIKGDYPNPKHIPKKYLLIAAISMSLYNILFFAGVSLTGVAIGTIVGIGSSPIFGGLLGKILFGEKLSKKWIIATIIGITGSTILLASNQDLSVDIRGILLAIGAGFAYAAYVVTSKEILKTNSIEITLAVIFSLGSLFLIPVFFFIDFSWITQLSGALVVLHLGVVTVVMAYSLFSIGLLRTDASKAVSLTLAEPLTAGILGVFFLGERLTINSGFGIGLIIIGLAILTFTRQAGNRTQ